MCHFWCHNLISWSHIKSVFHSECHKLFCGLLELCAIFITCPPLHCVCPYIVENAFNLEAFLLLRFLSFHLKKKIFLFFFPLGTLAPYIFSLSVFILCVNFSGCCVFLPRTKLPPMKGLFSLASTKATTLKFQVQHVYFPITLWDSYLLVIFFCWVNLRRDY